MILCRDAGPGTDLGPVVLRASRPSGTDSVGGWAQLVSNAFAAICDEDPHADLGDDLVMSIRSRSAASNVRKCRHEGATVDWIFRRWGRSVTVPSMTSVPTSDRHCFLDCDRSDQSASSLRTEDQSARMKSRPPGPCYAAGLLCRTARPGVLLPDEVGPGFPWVPSCSFLFPRGVCRGAGSWNAGPRGAAFTQVRDLWHWSG